MRWSLVCSTALKRFFLIFYCYQTFRLIQKARFYHELGGNNKVNYHHLIIGIFTVILKTLENNNLHTFISSKEESITS